MLTKVWFQGGFPAYDVICASLSYVLLYFIFFGYHHQARCSFPFVGNPRHPGLCGMKPCDPLFSLSLGALRSVPLSSLSCHAEAIQGGIRRYSGNFDFFLKSGKVVDDQLHIISLSPLKRLRLRRGKGVWCVLYRRWT